MATQREGMRSAMDTKPILFLLSFDEYELTNSFFSFLLGYLCRQLVNKNQTSQEVLNTRRPAGLLFAFLAVKYCAWSA